MRTSVLLTALASVTVASAQSTTSLYLPDTDPQPLTADVAGVDASGKTTWLVKGGGTEGLVGTATVVQGPSGVSATYSGVAPGPTLAINFQCDFDGGNAVCTAVDSDGTTVTETQPITSGLVAVTCRLLLLAQAPQPPKLVSASTGTATSSTGPATTSGASNNNSGVSNRGSLSGVIVLLMSGLSLLFAL
ncbi:hypothetical protein DFP72DRAFT_873421 [Ephemerocybe angulata]|uniref:Uncharacterized protein n=1 Tax=Ephemerocybe angulata TaxID=980116 RepID=A0A8H6MCU2_9AGAR|nr:hypothetical protein DFP72DRAFT_873421 [Tulosesus angulatus]